MKKIILLLFMVSFCFCQKNNDIVTNDTIFIKFTGKHLLEIKDEKLNYEGIDYKYFGWKEYDILYSFPMVIHEDKIIRFNKFIQYVDRKFIKKNEHRTISYIYFKNYKICQEFGKFFYQKRKMFYLIDCTDKKKGKIPIYPVTVYKSCMPIE